MESDLIFTQDKLFFSLDVVDGGHLVELRGILARKVWPGSSSNSMQFACSSWQSRAPNGRLASATSTLPLRKRDHEFTMPSRRLPFSKSDFLNRSRDVLADFAVCKAELEEIWDHFEGKVMKVERLKAKGRIEQARRLEYVTFTSQGARIICLLLGMRSPKTRNSQGRRPPHYREFAELKRMARRVNPRRPSGERVSGRWVDKPSGGKRPIASFGLIDRANQTMALAMGHLRAGKSKYEFASKGRGRDAAVEAIGKAIRKGGRYVASCDIRDAFGSITRADVHALKLFPRSVVDNTVFIPARTTQHLHGYNHTDLSTALRRTLPQGSSTSSFILQKLLESLFDKLQAEFVCSHGDDVFMVDATEDEVTAKLDALESLLELEPGGALRLKTKQVCKFGDHVNYLGYWPRWRKKAFGGGPRVTPSNEGLKRFYRRAARRVIWASGWGQGRTLEEYGYQWANSNRSWTGRAVGIEIAMYLFEEMIAPELEKARSRLLAEKRCYHSFGDLKAHVEATADKCVPDWVLVSHSEAGSSLAS